jgi:hypothetical protein
MNHTPAPWGFVPDRRDCYGSIRSRDGDGAAIATVQWTDSGSTTANARLIAAAPELLLALTGLMQYVGGWDTTGDHPCAVAMRAINEATRKGD